MPQSTLFDIFGDHHNRQAVKNVGRQPLSVSENMGKAYAGPKPNEHIRKGADFSAGPIKPNEKKTGEPKKSFLSNTGKALQGTPGQARQVFTPRGVNLTPLIYSDDNDKSLKDCLDKIQFTRPTNRHDDYKELIDFLLPEPKINLSPPPSPVLAPAFECNMDMDSSYDDDFITDNFSLDSIPDDNLDYKDLY